MKGPLFIMAIIIMVGFVLAEMGSTLVSAIKEWDNSFGISESIGTDGSY
jgi:hypothetical protein